MKLHYTNILLYSLLLNILSFKSSHVYNPKNPYITQHTSKWTKIPTTRLLCECDLYMSIYDNDPEMKLVMENFNKRTEERFHEYDERMIKNIQKCKEQCEEDIQKIILKDKIEKELTEKLAALQTDITTENIPTCVCEKSIADKTENFCLKCGYGLGSVSPSVGLFGALAVNQWTNAAMLTAAQKGIEAGIAEAIEVLQDKFLLTTLNGRPLTAVITAKNYKDINILCRLVQSEYNRMLNAGTIGDNNIFSMYQDLGGTRTIQAIAANSKTAATKAAAEAARVEGVEITAANTASYDLYIAIAYSVIAILVIVMVMVIIYLILRYRRKKKIKKKLQYIKLLKE